MRGMRGAWVSSIATVVLLLAGMLPAGAATIKLIHVTRPADLRFPAAYVPSGFAVQPSKNQVLSDAVLKPLIGTHTLRIFHQNGWTTGYHGWLNAIDPTGAPFVTYDMFAFKSARGAQAAQDAFAQLVQGLEISTQGSSLPANTRTWTDGTETFGPNNQPFAVAEVVFHMANVLVNVTGFYAGGGSDAISAALHDATIVAGASAKYLNTRLTAAHPAHKSLLLPLLPLAVLPRAARRVRSR